MRLMAGAGLVTEGFQDGQVGSSAMPHKANARNCERICGFSTVLGGYVTMTATLAGDQWNEGDVSCSVVRRVALPDAFFAIDGLLETFLTVLGQMEAFPSAIAQENERNLPFLATTTILMEAVKRGAGRETAHEAIKEHSLAAVKAMRSGSSGPDLLDRLAGDKRIGLGKKPYRRSCRKARVSSAPPRTRSTSSWPRSGPSASGSRAPRNTARRGFGRLFPDLPNFYNCVPPGGCACLDLHCPDQSLITFHMAELVGNVLVGQSGGPTSVINASVAGIVAEALNNESMEEIYGGPERRPGHPAGGPGGPRGRVQQQIRALKHTPGAALGTCRYKLKKQADFERVLEVFKAHNIRYFFYIGGNDSRTRPTRSPSWRRSRATSCA